MSSRGRLSVRESASSSGKGRNAAETNGITNLGTGTQKGTGTQTGTEIRMLQAAARAGAGAEAGPQEMRADKTEGSGGEAAAGAEADTEAGHTGTGDGNEAAAGTVLAARRVVAPENGGGSTAVADARRPHILAATYTVAKARFAVPLPAGARHTGGGVGGARVGAGRDIDAHALQRERTLPLVDMLLRATWLWPIRQPLDAAL